MQLNDNDYQGFTVAKSPDDFGGANKMRSYSTLGHNTPANFGSQRGNNDTSSGTNESRNPLAKRRVT